MNGAYVQTVPDTSILVGGTSYYPGGRVVSNTLIANNEIYGKTLDCPTGSASWQTRYIDRTILQLERRFEHLAREWKRETINLSSVQEIILNPAYQRIIGMGPDMIPFILQQLERCPGFWFWALRCLTGENPVTQQMRGDVAAMTEAWLNWGREHGYL
jgi:hypothetical protein